MQIYGAMITNRELQNRLLEIYRCLNEAVAAVESEDDERLQACLQNIREEADDMRECLPENMLAEFAEPSDNPILEDDGIEDIADSIDEDFE